MLRFLEAAMGKVDTPLKPAFVFAQQPWRELTAQHDEIGLCWMRSSSKKGLLLWHNGGTGGYATFMGFRPKMGVGVVVLCNRDDRSVDDLGAKLLEALEK
jgi:serine-type D-Ala-D-Ala carboxypeptidase/endopeptidase